MQKYCEDCIYRKNCEDYKSKEAEIIKCNMKISKCETCDDYNRCKKHCNLGSCSNTNSLTNDEVL